MSAEPPAAALPYRRGVGIMLLDGGGRVFAGRRVDMQTAAWQMPQGGIDAGESPREAALRELAEETGVARVRVLAESAAWLRYDLPEDLRKGAWGGRFRGQEQKWFAMRFLGREAEIDLALHNREFAAWRWIAPGELVRQIVPFKRAVYRAVVEEFSPLLAAATEGPDPD